MVFIIIGHYGSGKTNFACNIAEKLVEKYAGGETVAIADLDIVNPYFRTADYTAELEAAGVKVIASNFQTSTLDIPSLTFDLAALSGEYDNLIIDVGGDDEGAKVLGRYMNALDKGKISILYVVNFRRYLTRTAEDALEILREMEAVTGVKANNLVNNTNLAEETTAEVIAESTAEADKLAGFMDVKNIITVVPEGIDYKPLNAFTAKIIVNKPW
ncbi:MAG: cobalamin biosynthesis protein CobQ [Ruminococcus sp.]|jgi:Mrp family chromosome partitioning ATPase|nr:cobalamin biosynthesis protein CobQ [Ruminococcus sp.]